MSEHLKGLLVDLSGNSRGGSVAQPEACAPSPGWVAPAVGCVFSPQKRARKSVDTRTMALSRLTAAQVHIASAPNSDANTLTAYLLHVPEEVRQVQQWKKSAYEWESVAVCTVLLGDRTGPVLVDFWREAAEDALRDLKAWFDATQDPVLVEITRFHVRSAARKSSICIPEMRKIVCSDKSELKKLQSSDVPSISSADVNLAPELYVRDLSLLKGPLPFTASVSGSVTDVEEATETLD